MYWRGDAKNGPQSIGRFRGGWTTKLHMVVDRRPIHAPINNRSRRLAANSASAVTTIEGPVGVSRLADENSPPQPR